MVRRHKLAGERLTSPSNASYFEMEIPHHKGLTSKPLRTKRKKPGQKQNSFDERARTNEKRILAEF